MRFLFLTATVALLAGCGVALDFDPQTDLGTAGDGAVQDLGASDASVDAPLLDAAADAAADAPSSDLGLPDANLLDAPATDGAAGPCTSDGDCTVGGVRAIFCEFLPAVCGGVGVCTPVPGSCLAIAMPVCGCDGVDYGNPCEAQRARASVFSSGRCVRDGGVPDPCGAVTALPRGCTGDASCAVAIHQTDCCGNTAALGLNHSAVTEYDVLEPLCDATYPSCGCPVGPTTTDSGETAFDASTIQVACVVRSGVGMCMTYVSMRPPSG